MGSLLSLLFGVALVVVSLAAILALVRSASLGGADFEIRHRPGGRVEVRGRLPASKVPGIRAFFGRDLGAIGTGRVFGSFGPGRTVRLRFRGGQSPAQRQRIRNFMIEHLR